LNEKRSWSHFDPPVVGEISVVSIFNSYLIFDVMLNQAQQTAVNQLFQKF